MINANIYTRVKPLWNYLPGLITLIEFKNIYAYKIFKINEKRQ